MEHCEELKNFFFSFFFFSFPIRKKHQGKDKLDGHFSASRGFHGFKLLSTVCFMCNNKHRADATKVVRFVHYFPMLCYMKNWRRCRLLVFK